jgi:dTDP-4-dehydrorhamnose reductase
MSDGRPILILGANGQIGHAVAGALSIDSVIRVHRSDLGLENHDAIRRFIRDRNPRVVVNAAAYTAVDEAESDRGRCFAINAAAPQVLAEEVKACDALLIHYSTDYVFGGRKATPYVETDAVEPLNVYGETKAEADRAICASGARHVVLRTSWVYGPRGTNFMRTILRLARERQELRVVDDQIGAPTPASLIARVTAEIVRRENDRSGASLAHGLYHLAAAGETSWFGFAQQILTRDPRRDEQLVTRLTPISSAEFGASAVRPARSVLDSSKLQSALGMVMPEWHQLLGAVISGS